MKKQNVLEQNLGRRIWSVLLILALIITMIPAAVFADDSADVWDGTTITTEIEQIDGVYQIGTGAELAGFASIVNNGNVAINAVLTSDIDLGNHNWTPISTKANVYSGTFDGNGHSIKNLYMTEEEAVKTGVTNFCLGFFLRVQPGTIIKDLQLQGSIAVNNPSKAIYIGGFAAEVYSDSGKEIAYFENCINSVDITVSNATRLVGIGGIVGRLQTNIQAVACGNEANLTVDPLGAAGSIGGIGGAGGTGSVFESCWNAGEISSHITAGNSSASSNIGGITHSASKGTIISNCYNAAPITLTLEPEYKGTAACGGIAVANAKNKADIANCFYYLPEGSNYNGAGPDIADESGRVESKSLDDLKSPEFIAELNNFISQTEHSISWEAGPEGYPRAKASTGEVASKECQIKSFRIGETEAAIAEGGANETGTITAELPAGTDLTALSPVITVSEGASVSPESGTPQDFTDPVAYTVTAEDGATQKSYLVTLSLAPVKEGPIKSFSIGDNTGTIDDESRTIAISVPRGTDISNPDISLKEGADCSLKSSNEGELASTLIYEVTEAGNNPVLYTVTVSFRLNGYGTEDSPYLINEGEDLDFMSRQINSLSPVSQGMYWKQTADLDMKDIDFSPIGSGEQKQGWFSGVFDGGGFKIRNLTIDLPGESYVGLFGRAETCTIKNVTLDATCSIRGKINVGGILGSGVGLTGKILIENCRNFADVKSAITASQAFFNTQIGGIVGNINIKGSRIVGCSNYGTVAYEEATPGCAGGIVGFASIEAIIDCHNYGAVTAPNTQMWTGEGGSKAGGIVGNSGASLIGCSNSGEIYAGYQVGGIAATHTVAYPIESCSNVGGVTAADNYAGGIVGSMTNGIIGNCYNSAEIKALGSSEKLYAGKIAGVIEKNVSLIKTNYFAGTEPAEGAVMDSNAALTEVQMKPLTEAEMKTQAFVDLLNSYTQPESLTRVEFQMDEAAVNKGCPVVARLWEIEDFHASILSFSVAGRVGVIDEKNGTITVPYFAGKDVTALTPIITVSDGASVSPQGKVDFTNPVIFTVTGKDGVTKKEYTAALNVPENSKGLTYLRLDLGTDEKMPIELNQSFDQSVYDYEASIDDSTLLSGGKSLYVYYMTAQESPKIKGEFLTTALTSGTLSGSYRRMGAFPLNGLLPGENVLTFTVSGDGTDGSEETVYRIKLNVVPTLKSLTFAVKDGEAVELNKPFSPTETDYLAAIPQGTQAITFRAEAYLSPNVEITCNGQPAKQELSGEELSSPFEIVVAGTGDRAEAKTVYTVTPSAVGPFSVKLAADPEGAKIDLYDKTGTLVVPGEDGVYSLMGGMDYVYSYVVSKAGYVTAMGTVSADSELTDGVLTVTLEKATEGDLPNYKGDWINFRNSDTNMGITSAKTPRTADEAKLLWAVGTGSGYSAAPTPPIIVNGDMYLHSGDSVYRMDLKTGRIKATGKVAGKADFATNPMTYGEGKLFVLIGNGKVQALRADTLESLWISERVGGQTISPLIYSNGYLYTGTWSGESNKGTYFCLSATDEDPTQGTETKKCMWKMDHNGGFYWAGAYATENYVIFGSDNGVSEGDNAGTAVLYSVHPVTGAVLDRLEIEGGDIRSSIAATKDGYIYFTSKSGAFGKVKVNEDGTFAKDTLKLFEMGFMSTGTPVIYGGLAFVCASGESQFTDPGTLYVVDVETMKPVAQLETPGYVQSSALLSNAYEKDGKLYAYLTSNIRPGGIYVVEYDMNTKTLKGDYLNKPVGNQSEFCICSVICDSKGTLYYKNDSGFMFAISNKENKDNSSGSGSGGSGSSNTGTGGTAVVTPPAGTGESYATVTVEAAAKSSGTGSAEASISEKDMSGALAKAAQAVKTAESAGNKGVIPQVKIAVTTEAGASSISAALPTSSVNDIVKSKGAMTLATTLGELTFNPAALKSLADQSSGSELKLTVTKVDPAKTDALKNVTGIDDRPVYEITAVSAGMKITNFRGGNVTLSLAYTLKDGEQARGVKLSYVDSDGTLTALSDSSFNEKTKLVSASTDHFSYYAVTYGSPGYSDVKSGDWFYDAVMYLSDNGIVSGTSEDRFSPAAGITRAEFVQILYNKSGAGAGSSAKSAGFTDVKDGAWFADAVNWAYANGVATGTSDTAFTPDAKISRQDMAVMIANYLSKIEKKELKTVNEKTVFGDESKIAGYAKTAVETMQTGGIISGSKTKTGAYEFKPADNGTRAEAASMLAKLFQTVK